MADLWRTGEIFVGDKNALAPLIRVLSKLPDEKIFSFEDIMVELLYTLDTRKLFTQCKKANPNAGDRMFLNARCAALTGGKEYYEKVKACKMKWVVHRRLPGTAAPAPVQEKLPRADSGGLSRLPGKEDYAAVVLDFRNVGTVRLWEREHQG